jgi:NAD(P)-dependent dehydrogenase (short-subunit alcohol dehydrogenase family)
LPPGGRSTRAAILLPISIAGAAYVFLARDDASYVSGAVLGVTGGKPVF